MRLPNSYGSATGRSLRVLVAVSALTAVGLPVFAQGQDGDFQDKGFYQSYVFDKPADPSPAWIIAYGGRLYDQWWDVLLTDPPQAPHPSYPAVGRQSGPATWRCVECHGWDYRGKDGAYESGPHYTGTEGIDGAAGVEPARIVAVLRDDTHRFTPDMIPEEAALALALFVSRGQVKSAAAIDPRTGHFQGNPVRGRAVFQNVCAVCHDFDGGAWIEGEVEIGNTLGAIATNDPWRALHKVMNGQSYADMPAMRVLGLETVLDLLSYVQTLPHE